MRSRPQRDVATSSEDTLRGVTVADCAEDSLVPIALVAVTVKVYEVTGFNPLTVMVPDPAWLNVPVIPLGLEVAVYDVIVDPPLLAGAVYTTVAVLELVAVAVPIVGAPGTAAETVAVELEFAETADTALVAVTTQRTVLPTSAATNTYVEEVAPLILVVTRCH